jgi:ParB-like chromosome segregation protein Spo0J
VAQVAGDAAGTSAMQEMADFITSARAEGRLLVSIPLDQVETTHLERDRILPPDPAVDEEMQALMASLRERGQQTPIDVVRLLRAPGERYGLISGLRRLTALRLLAGETDGTRFRHVTARVVAPEGMPEAYLAMIEENEIRAGLSFYERARIALKAAEAGAFADTRAALRGLYGNVSRAKRSKIGSFLPVVVALDGVLRFPAALSEKRGLALAQALERDETLAGSLRKTLEGQGVATPEAEQAMLMAALAPQAVTKPARRPGADDAVAEGITLAGKPGRLVLSGPGVTDGLRADLCDWLRTRPGASP